MTAECSVCTINVAEGSETSDHILCQISDGIKISQRPLYASVHGEVRRYRLMKWLLEGEVLAHSVSQFEKSMLAGMGRQFLFRKPPPDPSGLALDLATFMHFIL